MVMAEDREVLREVWDGQLPLCFRLDPQEVATLQEPDPFYVMVPRIAYFPLIMDKVFKHFQRFLSDTRQQSSLVADMWLDHEGQPLKWHYPVGLLWDLLANDSQLPWTVTVHFSNFPEEEIVRCNTRPLIESMFMSSIKEADALKHRSQVISLMQKKDHNQLWLGLQNDKFDQFWSVNRRLMETGSHIGGDAGASGAAGASGGAAGGGGSGGQGNGFEEKYFRFIPFRIYRRNQHYIQRPIKPYTSQGDPVTLNDLLKTVLGPDVFESSQADKPPLSEQQQQEQSDSSIQTEGSPSKTRSPSQGSTNERCKYHVIVHGIEPPLETPLQWLSEHMSYADNFLHIVLHPRSHPHSPS